MIPLAAILVGRLDTMSMGNHMSTMKRRHSRPNTSRNRVVNKPASSQSIEDEIRPLINGDQIKPIPPDMLADEDGVRRCLRAIEKIAGDDQLRSASDCLEHPLFDELISWRETSTILQCGVQYGQLYAFLSDQARSNNAGYAVEYWPGSAASERSPKHIRKVDLRFIVRQEFLSELKHIALILKGKEPFVDQSKSDAGRSVATVFEQRQRTDKKLQSSVMQIARRLRLPGWIYCAQFACLAVFDEDFNFSVEHSFSFNSEASNREILEKLKSLCRLQALAQVGTHLDQTTEARIVDVRVQRLYFSFDLNTFATWVSIPHYYKYSHLDTSSFSDFKRLKEYMSGPDFKQPGKADIRQRIQIVRAKMQERRKMGITPAQAWEEARKVFQWSEKTMKARIGPKPKH